MQGGGFGGRVDAEEEADAGGDDQGGDDGGGADDRVPAAERGQQDRAADADADADEAADQGDDRRFDQELQHDVARRGADRFPDADLAGPLGHRDEHDVHDPDAADDHG